MTESSEQTASRVGQHFVSYRLAQPAEFSTATKTKMARKIKSQTAAARLAPRPRTRSETVADAPASATLSTRYVRTKTAKPTAPATAPVRHTTRLQQTQPSDTLSCSRSSKRSFTSRRTAPETQGPSALDSLPAELLGEIVDHLASTYSLGSLASLNVSCNYLRRLTLPVLYRSLILVRRDKKSFVELDVPPPMRKDQPVPEGYRHVR
jgi:hypothetical protein